MVGGREGWGNTHVADSKRSVTMNWSSMVAVLIVYLVGWSINISKELELTKKCNLVPLAVFGSELKSPV